MELSPTRRTPTTMKMITTTRWTAWIAIQAMKTIYSPCIMMTINCMISPALTKENPPGFKMSIKLADSIIGNLLIDRLIKMELIHLGDSNGER